MDITANFNDIVNDYVARNNISYNRFSELSGISSTNLYVILQSDSCPGLPTFIKAADFLTCSVDYLMGLSENPNYTPAEKPAAFYERTGKTARRKRSVQKPSGRRVGNRVFRRIQMEKGKTAEARNADSDMQSV